MVLFFAFDEAICDFKVTILVVYLAKVAPIMKWLALQ